MSLKASNFVRGGNKVGKEEADTGVLRGKNVTKMDIYRGSCRIHIFFFLTFLLIFVPRIEVLLFINHFSSMYI